MGHWNIMNGMINPENIVNATGDVLKMKHGDAQVL